MARIRTIKPDFFRHEGLFEAEKETGLPLRVAFAGLWTAADREGRFRWSPRALKLDCLPYDEVDFSRVLHALGTRGFIVKYAVDGTEFGAIPSWNDHQAINNKERASDIPEYNENNALTCEPRVNDATATREMNSQGEGKGREGERKGMEDAAGAAILDFGKPIEPQPTSQEKQFYDRAREVLGKSGTGLAAKLLKVKGELPLARAALEQASTKTDPREYVGACIRGNDPGGAQRGMDPRF